MSQQQENTPQQKKPPTVKEMFQASVADASRVMENTETVTGTPRLIAEGGLLGACIVFLAAMLGLPKPDTQLTIALLAFSLAIPILSFIGLMIYVLIQYRKEQRKKQTAPEEV